LRRSRESARKTWLVRPPQWRLTVYPREGAPRLVGLATLLERVLPACILGLAVVGVPVLVFQSDGLPRMRALQKELADVTEENAVARRDIGRLKAEVRDLRDN